MAAVFRPVATLSRIQMATMAPSAERGPTMKRSMDWIIISMQPPFFQQVDLGEQRHNQQDGGDRALDALHDEAACAQGFRTEMMSLKVMVPVTSPREYAGDDAIAQRLQQVALEQAEDHHHHGHQQGTAGP